jgi:hypothetical protein
VCIQTWLVLHSSPQNSSSVLARRQKIQMRRGTGQTTCKKKCRMSAYAHPRLIGKKERKWETHFAHVTVNPPSSSPDGRDRQRACGNCTQVMHRGLKVRWGEGHSPPSPMPHFACAPSTAPNVVAWGQMSRCRERRSLFLSFSPHFAQPSVLPQMTLLSFPFSLEVLLEARTTASVNTR